MQLSPQAIGSARLVVHERDDHQDIYCARAGKHMRASVALMEELDGDVKNMNSTCAHCGCKCAN